MLGLIGLKNVDGEFLPSLSLRVIIASTIALTFCLVGLPLILPWFVAFLPAYCFIPKKSILWQPWICTIAGILGGISPFLFLLKLAREHKITEIH
jgi:hypothetical protein